MIYLSVNGLSWDVVRLLGETQKLHTLAIEDLLHTRNRTKADWYPEHVFGKCSLYRKSFESILTGKQYF
jgi:hypothetical protein